MERVSKTKGDNPYGQANTITVVVSPISPTPLCSVYRFRIIKMIKSVKLPEVKIKNSLNVKIKQSAVHTVYLLSLIHI